MPSSETLRFIAFFFAVTIGMGILGGIVTSWIDSLAPRRCSRLLCHCCGRRR